MAKLYRSREGAVTAVDTKSQLTTLGSETAPGPLLVPQGVKTLVGIIVAIASDFSTAADGSFLTRLEGPGLPEGPEVIAVGSVGAAVATGAHAHFDPVEIPLNVPVTPANEILIFGENVGEDNGSNQMAVTLVFA